MMDLVRGKGVLHPLVERAYGVLETGLALDRVAALELAGLSGEHVLDLASLANKVRIRYAPDAGALHACSIINAKSGVCGENCRFCAQSRHNHADVEVYGLLDEEAVLRGARAAVAGGVNFFGVVTSGYGYKSVTPEFERILAIIRRLHVELPELHVCASLGMLGREPVAALAAAGISHYNINVQVSQSRYAELIADTHSVEERTSTVRLLREHGISVCCGGIIGVGEQMADRVAMLAELQALDVSVIPLNVLVPVAGTPLEEQQRVPVEDVVRTFAIARLMHPGRIIKFAAGRETVMKDFQGLLLLSGANGYLTGGYLTTRGRDMADDALFAMQLSGFGPEQAEA